jgi:hypothetical protein
MAKIKIEDIAKVEDLDEAEQQALRGAGFAAWLKNRSPDTSEAEELADEEAEERAGMPPGTPETKAEPSSEA